MKNNTLAKKIFDTLPFIIKVIKKSVKIHSCPLTPNQIKVLHIIGHDSSTVDELAQIFNITSPTMSETIDGLSKKNLVKKIKSKEDGRVYNIILTSNAKKMVANAHKKIVAILGKKLNNLTLKEKKILTEALSILQKTFSTNKN